MNQKTGSPHERRRSQTEISEFVQGVGSNLRGWTSLWKRRSKRSKLMRRLGVQLETGFGCSVCASSTYGESEIDPSCADKFVDIHTID